MFVVYLSRYFINSGKVPIDKMDILLPKTIAERMFNKIMRQIKIAHRK